MVGHTACELVRWPLQDGIKTPAYQLSAGSTGASPHVSGQANPATNFREGKAVRARGTPFEDRCVWRTMRPCLRGNAAPSAGRHAGAGVCVAQRTGRGCACCEQCTSSLLARCGRCPGRGARSSPPYSSRCTCRAQAVRWAARRPHPHIARLRGVCRVEKEMEREERFSSGAKSEFRCALAVQLQTGRQLLTRTAAWRS